MNYFRVDDIGRNIVAAAKQIVIKQHDHGKETDEGNRAFESRVDSKLQLLENKVGSLEDKLDLILRKMTKIGN